MKSAFLAMSLVLLCVAAIDKPTHAAEILDRTPRTAVMSAFEPEWTALKATMSGREDHVVNGKILATGTIEHQPVVLFLSGISMVNAAMSTQLVLDRFTIKRIVFSGIAGGVNPDLEIGDVVVPDEWCQYLEAVFAREKARSYTLPGFTEKTLANFGMMFPQPVQIAMDGHKPEKRFWFPVDRQLLATARSAAGSMRGRRSGPRSATFWPMCRWRAWRPPSTFHQRGGAMHRGPLRSPARLSCPQGDLLNRRDPASIPLRGVLQPLQRLEDFLFPRHRRVALFLFLFDDVFRRIGDEFFVGKFRIDALDVGLGLGQFLVEPCFLRRKIDHALERQRRDLAAHQ